MIKKLEPRPYVITDGITQSMLASFLTCRQKSQYQLDRWEPIATTSSMNRGNLFHLALELWYGHQYHNLPFLPAVEERWRQLTFKQGPVDPIAFEESMSLLQALWPHYTTHWKHADSKFTWHSLEQVFDVVWNGFRLRGKFDGIAKINNKYWLFETKTKASIDEDGLLDQLQFDFQVLYYLTAMRALGIEGNGVIYNVIRIPTLLKKESIQERMERLSNLVLKDPKYYFMRLEVSYSQDIITRFELELLSKLKDYQAWTKGSLPTYRNETACIGRMKCPFLKACASQSLVGYKRSKQLFKELRPNE